MTLVRANIRYSYCRLRHPGTYLPHQEEMVRRKQAEHRQRRRERSREGREACANPARREDGARGKRQEDNASAAPRQAFASAPGLGHNAVAGLNYNTGAWAWQPGADQWGRPQVMYPQNMYPQNVYPMPVQLQPPKRQPSPDPSQSSSDSSSTEESVDIMESLAKHLDPDRPYTKSAFRELSRCVAKDLQEEARKRKTQRKNDQAAGKNKS